MNAHADEVFRSSFLIKTHQVFRVEFLRLPRRNDILEPELAWMAIARNVAFILLAPLHVHVARVPISCFGSRLWTPVRPYAEFGIAEPFGSLISGQRLLRRLEWTGSDL